MRIISRDGNGWISQTLEEYWVAKVFGVVLVVGSIIAVVQWIFSGFDPTWADPFFGWFQAWGLPAIRLGAPLATAAIGIKLVVELRAVGKLHRSMFFALLAAGLGLLGALLVCLPIADSRVGLVTVFDYLWAGGVVIIFAGVLFGIVAAVYMFSPATPLLIAAMIVTLVNALTVLGSPTHHQATEAGSVGWLIATSVLAGLAFDAWPTKQAVQAGLESAQAARIEFAANTARQEAEREAKAVRRAETTERRRQAAKAVIAAEREEDAAPHSS